jgi:hypothetical protein
VGGNYEDRLDSVAGAVIKVDFQTVGRDVISYSVVLVCGVGGRFETVRVYDSAHGFNEMHRYGRHSGKSSGKRFHSGTLGEGMRAAISEIRRAHEVMIEGWRE